MGKTNLLDGVYYLCMGKSHLGGTDRNVVQRGKAFFRLEGLFSKNEKEEKVVVKVVPGQLKQIELNGKAWDRLSEHVGHFPVVFKAPDDSALALEGSEERRRFIDVTLCQLDPRYLEALITYNRLLDRRNATLKMASGHGMPDMTLVQAYADQMSAPAHYIFDCRKAFIEELEPLFNAHFSAISGGREHVYLHYRSQLQQDDFQTLMRSRLEKDRLLQRTTAGIHRDELLFELDDLPLKRFASQGQLKSFILALKMAQFDCLRLHKNTTPILLLDDLFDKLDDERVNHLIQRLVEGPFGQVFITDTHPDRAETIARRFGGAYGKFLIDKGQAATEHLSNPQPGH